MINKKLFCFSFIILAVLVLGVFYFLHKRQKADESLKKRIGQMLIVGFRGTEINEHSFIVKAIQDLNLGGVVLFDIDGPTKSFPRNIINTDQVKELIRRL